MINVTIQLKGLDKVDDLLGRIKRQMPRVADQTTGDVGKEATKVIRKTIREGGITPALTQYTKRKRDMGKLAGPGGPAIPRYSGTKPLVRSGAMAQAIRYKKVGKGAWQMFIASVPGEYSGGKQIPLSTIAYLQEVGFSRRIDVTYRMMRYLSILLGFGRKSSKKGKGNRSGWPDGKTGKVIEINVPARPVFTQTFDSIGEAQFDAWIEASLRKRLKVF